MKMKQLCIWFMQTLTDYYEIWYAGKDVVGHSRNGNRILGLGGDKEF
jgi:hypothetical protein